MPVRRNHKTLDLLNQTFLPATLSEKPRYALTWAFQADPSSICLLAPPHATAMPTIHTSLLARAEERNWAYRNPGVTLVFAIVGVGTTPPRF